MPAVSAISTSSWRAAWTPWCSHQPSASFRTPARSALWPVGTDCASHVARAACHRASPVALWPGGADLASPVARRHRLREPCGPCSAPTARARWPIGTDCASHVARAARRPHEPCGLWPVGADRASHVARRRADRTSHVARRHRLREPRGPEAPTARATWPGGAPTHECNGRSPECGPRDAHWDRACRRSSVSSLVYSQARVRQGCLLRLRTCQVVPIRTSRAT